MKVRLTQMRYMNNTRLYPGTVIDWPFEKLGQGMVVVDKPSPAQPVQADEAPADKRPKARKPVADQEVL